MKHKIVIVAGILWLLSLAGGALSVKISKAWRLWATPPEVLEIEKAKLLFDAHLFTELDKECVESMRDPRYAAIASQLLYIQWMTNRQLGRVEMSKTIERHFLDQFPQNILGADMRYENGISDVSVGEYTAALKEFTAIVDLFPSAPTFRRAKMLQQAINDGIISNASRIDAD